MDSSDEEGLLQSCSFLLNYHQDQIKRKRKKDVGVEVFYKRVEQAVYHNLFQEMRVNDGGRIAFQVGYLYNEFFSQSNEQKCTVFLSMAWSLIVHKNTIKNYSTALQAFSFRSLFVSLISFFIKARILLQFLSQGFSILYMFSIFSFVFVNDLISST